ncbi:MAG: thiamine phosphate synthase [Novosphingobium sp.]
MARCYSDAAMKRQPPLPRIFLVSDARNDAGLESALARLPRGSGLIFRHYHLPPRGRRARFERLRKLARRRGHLVFLAADARAARAWRADGVYGPAAALARGPALPRLVTAHSLREIGRAQRAAAIVLSPVFATRSHPGAQGLGTVRFRLLARWAGGGVIALGGMTGRRARALGTPWAAIDGLTWPSACPGPPFGLYRRPISARIPKDS